MNFWSQPPRKTEASSEGERRRLAAQIIADSGAMPDPDKHMNWLLGMSLERLRERARIIRSQTGPELFRDGRGYREIMEPNRQEVAA